MKVRNSVNDEVFKASFADLLWGIVGVLLGGALWALINAVRGG